MIRLHERICEMLPTAALERTQAIQQAIVQGMILASPSEIAPDELTVAEWVMQSINFGTIVRRAASNLADKPPAKAQPPAAVGTIPWDQYAHLSTTTSHVLRHHPHVDLDMRNDASVSLAALCKVLRLACSIHSSIPDTEIRTAISYNNVRFQFFAENSSVRVRAIQGHGINLWHQFHIISSFLRPWIPTHHSCYHKVEGSSELEESAIIGSIRMEGLFSADRRMLHSICHLPTHRYNVYVGIRFDSLVGVRFWSGSGEGRLQTVLIESNVDHDSRGVRIPPEKLSWYEPTYNDPRRFRGRNPKRSSAGFAAAAAITGLQYVTAGAGLAPVLTFPYLFLLFFPAPLWLLLTPTMHPLYLFVFLISLSFPWQCVFLDAILFGCPLHLLLVATCFFSRQSWLGLIPRCQDIRKYCYHWLVTHASHNNLIHALHGNAILRILCVYLRFLLHDIQLSGAVLVSVCGLPRAVLRRPSIVRSLESRNIRDALQALFRVILQVRLRCAVLAHLFRRGTISLLYAEQSTHLLVFRVRAGLWFRSPTAVRGVIQQLRLLRHRRSQLSALIRCVAVRRPVTRERAYGLSYGQILCLQR